MLKGLYLVYSTLNLEKPNGIERKILSQIELMKNKGAAVEIKTLKRENGTFWNYNSDFSKYDFIYFRRSTIIDFRFRSFFKKLKSDNPSIKVLMEIPTFPYEGEYEKTFKNKVSLVIDNYYRTKLVGLLDYIIITGQYEKNDIWGIKAIQIVNGIDMSSVRVADCDFDDDLVTISCIARFSPWHGYERLILGLKEYFEVSSNRKIRIYMVGDGPEKEYYERLVKDNNLEDNVIFTGQLIGKDLENIYNKTDIGCCSLGRYKTGLNVIGDLKSREFMAKGIPMILGCNIDVLQDIEYPYAIYYPNDESNINIEKVLSFYCELLEKYSKSELRNIIRDYASGLVDLKATFKPVLDVLSNQ